VSTFDEARGGEILREMAEAEQAGTWKARIEVGPYAHFMIITGLQLAWRHPEISAQIKDIWWQVGHQMMIQQPPEIAVLLERGWDPAQDVPRE
jgi:hypothetical protein